MVRRAGIVTLLGDVCVCVGVCVCVCVYVYSAPLILYLHTCRPVLPWRAASLSFVMHIHLTRPSTQAVFAEPPPVPLAVSDLTVPLDPILTYESSHRRQNLLSIHGP